MHHLFNRGFYKPMGFLEIRYAKHYWLYAQIYGNIAEEKSKNGLLYVIERVPVGIEECRLSI
jgi:hypothetical protein